MRRALALSGLAALIAAGPASAYPDGAPWGHAGEPGGEDCQACHYDAPPVRQSADLALDGLPGAVRAGETYRLTLRLDAPADVAGFQIAAMCGERRAGVFAPVDDNVEGREGEARSVSGGPEWAFDWTAPEALDGEIVFYVAANAGNDDMSPFGDVTHLLSFPVTP